MVQLRSFKYLEGEASNVASAPQSVSSSPSSLREAPPSATHQVEGSPGARSSSIVSQSTSASSLSSEARGALAPIGGNLTTTDGSGASEAGGQMASRRSNNEEEYQSARLDLETEDEASGRRGSADSADSSQQEPTGSSNSSSGGGGKSGGDNNVTKIEIGSEKENYQRQLKPAASKGAQAIKLQLNHHHHQPPKTPLTPRLRLHMQRSQTSPSQLGPLALSPKQLRGLASPLASPLIGLAGKRAPSLAGDNTSQSSYAMQQRNNQFEIRWHNVSLYTRPKSRLPGWVANNFLFRSVFGADASTSAAAGATTEGSAALGLDQSCYSPPVQHKIPPTIDEGLEMKLASERAAPAACSLQRAPSKSPSKLERPADRGAPAAAAATRCILNNVSGQVFSGQMTAILGPSGVGKTSLLNSLTGRNTLEGTGRVNLMGARDSKRMCVVTVPQVDVLPGKLTALEDLQFTSRLKNPQARFGHGRNIERVVKCLHMDKFLHTRIDKLSGGEARRLSIGRELLNSPDIMILDEPTSGLDANTCKKIIAALRNIVEHSDNILDKPMSIIITIHQPQQEVYNIFHRVYVMALGGRVIYEGAPQMLLPTLLEQSSLARACPPEQLNENPAIVAIEVASGEFGPQIINELAAYHENQVYEEFVLYSANAMSSPLAGGGIGSESPLATPRSVRQAHKSPLSVSRFDVSQHRRRLNSFDSSLGRPTPVLAKRQLGQLGQLDRVSSMTSLSYVSEFDADLPEPVSKLKVDKRLRRSVVMKSNFWRHTLVLVGRCWLLTKRDMFLMAIRILGFLLVAAGTVQIFSHALDPEEHQCPQFESEVDDMFGFLGHVKTRLLSLLEVLRQGNSTHLFFFHLLLCITMVTSALTGLVFPLQMRMFVREYKNGWYSPASFIMSQTIAELPADVIGPILTLLITYPLCHQPDSMYHWRQLGYAVVLVACCIICKSQAQIVGAFLMDSVENSVFISCVCVTGPALLSGIPLRIDQMIAPMQWVSYGSFLRYAFESLLALRYGYGMCPCDPELVNGYPVMASARAIPPHLENLAVGLLTLSQPLSNATSEAATSAAAAAAVATITSDGLATGIMATTQATQSDGQYDNLFLRFIRLVTDASNMFIGGAEIGDCKNYRSLYLIGMKIPKDVLNNWIPVMVLMFLISRILTYFAVKTVIKLRRS